MPTLNGDQAINWMRAKVTNVPGACLNTIWQAYGSHPSTGPHAGQYPNAIDGWNYATRRHPGDWEPPAGYPVYFDALSRPRYAGDENYPCGDIVLSLGGGDVICTDGAGGGRIAVMTIAQRARQIGRTYLGWTEDFLGYDVVTSAAASLGATPLTPQGDEIDMASIADLQKAVAGAPIAASFLPLCIQNHEANPVPLIPGIAIFSNGFVEPITAQQWDMFGFAGAKQYYTTNPGHFAEFIRQAALVRASYGTAQPVEFSQDDLQQLSAQIAAKLNTTDPATIADAVADELAQRIKS